MLNMRSWIFFLAAGALTALFHVYLYRRLFRDTTRKSKWRRAGLVGCALLWVVFIAARTLQPKVSPSWWSIPLFAGTWLWIAFATYLVFGLCALGFLRELDNLRKRLRSHRMQNPPVSSERRLFLSRAVAGGAVTLAGGLTPYGMWRAFEGPQTSELAVRLPRLPKSLDGFTIVQISDLHVSPLIGRRFVDELVQRCNALKPDLVAVTGDLVDGTVPSLGNSVAALANLQSRFGTYFVTGNHDYYSGDREWCAALAQMGMTVLRNRWVSIGDGDASFDLVGVDDWGARFRYQRRSGYNLEGAMTNRDPSKAAVLLAHQPANFEEAVKQGIGLQLSGHTHGGQFFPVTLLVPFRWPRFAGLYEYDDGKLYVSRGTGFWGPPLRVGSPPEIVKVTLTA